MVFLAGGFVHQGLEVDLVLTRARGPYLGDVPAGVRVVDLGARRIIFSLPGLFRYLRRERPAVMLSMLSTTNCVSVWARDLARVNTRVVVNEQNTPTQARANTPHRRMRTLPTLMRWTYPRADAVTAISTGVAEDVAHVTGLRTEEVAVIYNPVVSSALQQASAEPVDHPWFDPGQPPVVLGAGRLVDQKDFPTLLRAFARVRRMTDARLMLIGEGEGRDSLERLANELGIADDVALPGFVANPYAYMARSAVFVLSSRWEGLGMVLIEAMACGTPVVSSDCPSGPCEILEGGRWGRLVPVGSVERLAQGILQTLANPGPDPRRRAEQFSVERAVERYLQVLRLER